MKYFSLQDLQQLKKGQLLLQMATLNNTSKDLKLVDKELIEIEDMLSSIEFQIEVKKRAIQIQE